MSVQEFVPNIQPDSLLGICIKEKVVSVTSANKRTFQTESATENFGHKKPEEASPERRRARGACWGLPVVEVPTT